MPYFATAQGMTEKKRGMTIKLFPVVFNILDRKTPLGFTTQGVAFSLDFWGDLSYNSAIQLKG